MVCLRSADILAQKKYCHGSATSERTLRRNSDKHRQARQQGAKIEIPE
jgi:hypothetical protein